MATVKRGILTSSPQWWRHLRDWKRVFWKRPAAARDIFAQMPEDRRRRIEARAAELMREERAR